MTGAPARSSTTAATATVAAITLQTGFHPQPRPPSIPCFPRELLVKAAALPLCAQELAVLQTLTPAYQLPVATTYLIFEFASHPTEIGSQGNSAGADESGGRAIIREYPAWLREHCFPCQRLTLRRLCKRFIRRRIGGAEAGKPQLHRAVALVMGNLNEQLALLTHDAQV
ncbi:hypothetical protein DL765_002342 [Monosporascus sp. GIB2]|nr:hypothetical protein DL765_002342 [Monosporascus sp. GIB2]